MPRNFRQVQSSSPSQVPGSYIYSVLPVQVDKLAALTSANELLTLDRRGLELSRRWLHDVPKPAACMTGCDRAESIIFCAGGDGVVAIFDVRSEGRVAHFKIDRPVTAVARGDREVAVGSEVLHSQATISIWDDRTQRIRWQTVENNDDITALQYHPADQTHLLSGGDDGLVSVFDTEIEDGNESLIQAFDHAPIHKAGFLSQSRIYALSADQQLTIHPRHYPMSEDAEVIQPVVFGDLRPMVKCDYVIDAILQGPHSPYIVTGSHVREMQVDLIPIVDKPEYSFSMDNILRLERAHGEEIVRSVYVDNATETIFTAGEDGNVKAFRISTDPTMPVEAPNLSGKGTGKNRAARFKPY